MNVDIARTVGRIVSTHRGSDAFRIGELSPHPTILN